MNDPAPPERMYTPIPVDTPLPQGVWVRRSMPDGCRAASIEVCFPGGLGRYGRKWSERSGCGVTFEVSASPAGAEQWTPPAAWQVGGMSSVAIRMAYQIDLPPTEPCEVAIRRLTDDDESPLVRSRAVWANVRPIMAHPASGGVVQILGNHRPLVGETPPDLALPWHRTEDGQLAIGKGAELEAMVARAVDRAFRDRFGLRPRPPSRTSD